MSARTVRVEYPIQDDTLPAPHLRLLARGMLTSHLDQLGVVAVGDATVRVDQMGRVVIATVEVQPRRGEMWNPAPEVTLCPACHALLSGAAA